MQCCSPLSSRLRLWRRSVLLTLLAVADLVLAGCQSTSATALLPAPTVTVTAGLSTTPAPTVLVNMTRAPTDTIVPTHAPSATASTVPSPTASATATAMPTATPSARSQTEPTLGYRYVTPAADAALPAPIPTPVSELKVDRNVVNILLIGTDYRPSLAAFHTDTTIIVSINKDSGLVTLLSIPRDLYVYIAGAGMQRINTAYIIGQNSSFPGGGAGLLEQTILYNLGIPIHYYAVVNFDGFRKIVDTLGGIDVPVNCQVTEYMLKDPTLDESVPANYELHTQPVGVTHMDGALALWYARARPVGADFFRGYRQRQVLRAIYHKALRTNLIPQIPTLYGNFNDVVKTDMGLWDVMQFAPLATKLTDTQIRSLNVGPNQTTGWRSPAGEDVLVPEPQAMQALITQALTAPANPQTQTVTPVEIWNNTLNPDLGHLAAETLANEGFAPVLGQPDGTTYPDTTLVDFTINHDRAPIKKLQSFLHVEDKNVVTQPDPNSPVPYRLIVGGDYNSCPRLDWMDDSGVTPASTALMPATQMSQTPTP